jgi:hypothetical protein
MATTHYRPLPSNKITGPNAGGPRQFPIWTPLAARVGQFWRSAKTQIMKSKIILILSLFVLFESSVCAAVITYNYSGQLNDSFGTLPADTPFNGSFSYDSLQPLNTVVDASGDPVRGDYVYTQFSLNISGQLFTSNSGVIYLYDYDPVAGTGFVSDLLQIYTLSLSGSLGGLTLAPDAGIIFTLQDSTGNAFNGLGLPGGDLTLDDFSLTSGTFLELREQFRADFSLGAISRGDLSSLSAVPEPSSRLLFLGGLCTLLFARLRCDIGRPK